MAACPFPNPGPSNTPLNIVEITSDNPFSYPIQTLPIFMINHKGDVGINMLPKNQIDFSVGGRSYFNGNTQIVSKFRISANTNLNFNDWNNVNFPYTFSVDNGNSRFLGTVQIGTQKAINSYANFALSVDGDIIAKRVVVQTADWADYVFNKTYSLMSIDEVETFINTNHHLPNMPSQDEVINSGQDIATLQKLQQAKIEELILYIIALKKEIDEIKVANLKN
jgi:hypothetical protein